MATSVMWETINQDSWGSKEERMITRKHRHRNLTISARVKEDSRRGGVDVVLYRWQIGCSRPDCSRDLGWVAQAAASPGTCRSNPPSLLAVAPSLPTPMPSSQRFSCSVSLFTEAEKTQKPREAEDSWEPHWHRICKWDPTHTTEVESSSSTSGFRKTCASQGGRRQLPCLESRGDVDSRSEGGAEFGHCGRLAIYQKRRW